jgi:error-prone DNA polymerase
MSGRVLREKIRNGEFMSLKNFVSRVDIPKSLTSSVISSGAFDLLGKRDRKQKQWELGLIEPYYSNQKNMEFSNKESFIELKNVSSKEKMYEEYDSLGMYPKGHLMSFIRKDLGNGILKSTEIIGLKDGEKARVAGVVIRRQRPHKKKTVFLTLEDEFGHIPVVVWPDIFEDNKRVIKSHGMIVKGHISRLNGSMNLVAEEFEPITTNINFSRNWF